MKKEIDAMSDRELLMELVAAGRREEKRRVVRLCIAALLVLAIAVLCAVYVPRLAATLRRVNETMDKVQSMTEQAQSFFDAFKEVSADKLAETIETVSDTAQEAREIMDKLSEAGLDSLQQSIRELSEFADRVKGIFGR